MQGHFLKKAYQILLDSYASAFFVGEPKLFDQVLVHFPLSVGLFPIKKIKNLAFGAAYGRAIIFFN